MHLKILPEHLDLATELVVRTLDQLELTLILVGLHLTSEGLHATLVVAFDHFVEAAFIVRLRILDHQQRHAVLVLAHDFLVPALLLVSVHVFSL